VVEMQFSIITSNEIDSVYTYYTPFVRII